jgi:LCP family protein required for cell wall assembly
MSAPNKVQRYSLRSQAEMGEDARLRTLSAQAVKDRLLNHKPYTIFKVESSHRRSRLRILLWGFVCVVVLVLAAGGGSYLWFHHVVAGANARVDAVARAALTNTPPSTPPSTLQSAPPSTPVSPAVPESPSSMDILVLGSDNRGDETNGRSDTLILVHVDPSQNYLSILSIPRDLRVNIPGRGLDKINAAYSYGGAALSIRTVKELTGVNISHYLEVGFSAFQDLTNALGGVYVDVDRRYYNDDPTRELIKLAPGYQLLNGHDALEYVRFRHDQNGDFGRIERQQRFLSLLKQQVAALGPSLLFKLPGLVGALFANVSTDLNANDVLKLAYWGLQLNGDRIRQVRITGETPTIGGVSYVVTSPEAIKQAVADLLTPLAVTGGQPAGSATGTSAEAAGTTSSATQVTSGHVATSLETIPNSSEWKALGSMIPFPLEGPGYIPPGYEYCDRMPPKGGTYDIKVGGGTKPALKMVYRHLQEDEYLGITETTWLQAPMASKGEEVKYDGLTYTVVGTSQKVDHVWWKQDGVLYWVSNALSYLLDEQELLKMAESFISIPRP